MSMNMHVVGFRSVDQKWRQMRDVWEACKAANIQMPIEVERFFEDGPPDANGVRVSLDDHPCVKQWKDDMKEGVEIKLDMLPDDVKIVRFYNSW